MKNFKVKITYTNEYTIKASNKKEAIDIAKDDIEGFKEDLEVDDFDINII